MIELLDTHDLVRPRNYLAPLPFRARTEAARMLTNRAWLAEGDYPGTLGIRREIMMRMREKSFATLLLRLYSYDESCRTTITEQHQLTLYENGTSVDAKPITLFELLSLIISIAGFIVVIVSIFLLKRQVSIADRGLRETWLIPLKTQQLEIDKLFIDRPHLRKYFYEGEHMIDSRSDEYVQVTATSEYILDHLSGVISQKTSDGKPLVSTIWREYIKDGFANSPALCSTLEKHKHWYPKELWDIKEEALQFRER